MVKFENILFWILIVLIVGLAIWKLIGSPTDTAALISLALFVAGSEILIWRAFFSIDKKTTIEFMKLKHELTTMENSTTNKLENIENLIKVRK